MSRFKSSFATKVLSVAGGTAISQGIAIATAPFLTRLYGPADFGVFAIYSSLLSICAVLVTLRYELAIPLPKDDEEGADLVGLCVLLGLVFSGTLWTIISLKKHSIARLIGAEPIEPYLWILPIGLVGYSSYQALSYWAGRLNLFGVLGKTKAAQGAAQAGFQLLAGLFRPGYGSGGLIAGSMFSQFVGVTALLRKSRIFAVSFRPRRWISVAKKYRAFALYTVWASLIDAAGIQAPALLFPKSFDLVAAGNFSLAMRILALPSVFVSQAVGQVFYPIVAQKDDAAARLLVHRLSRVLLMISLSVFGLIIINGEFLFRIVFGTQWKLAGIFARLLAPWLIIAFVTSPLSTFVLARGKQRQAFFFSVANAACRIGAILAGAALHSATLAAAFFSAVGFVLYIGYWEWLLRIAGSSLIRFVAGSIREILWLVSGIVVGCAIARFISPWLSTAVFIAQVAVLYPRFSRAVRDLHIDEEADKAS